MNYEITATRKRPQVFSDLAGQEFVVSTLTRSIETGRIAHAYLFSGPRGVGKTSSARILAKALNCEKGPTPVPCGKCSNCVEIQKGNSLDVIEIDGASNTSVNDIREIRDEVLFAPNTSRKKIYIIDEVHMLSNSAFNALLKTIEEPPPYIVFIFATTEIHKVPATIRSRCQQFIFRLVAPEITAGLLSGLCRETQVKAEEEALFWIAKEATGSLRDAFTLFDQVVSFSDGVITLEKIRQKMGLVGLDQMNELVGKLVEGDREAVLESANEILLSGVPIEQFISDLAEYFRNLLLIASGITRESILGYKPERFSSKAINELSLSRLEQGISIILDLYRKIRYSVNPRFELELVLCRLAALKDFLCSSEIVERLESLKRQAASGRIIAAVQQPDPVINNENPGVSEQPDVPDQPRYSREKKKPGDIALIKDELVNRFKKRKLALSSALEKALEWSLPDESTITVIFSNAYTANMIRNDQPEISQALNEILGRTVDLHIEIAGESGREANGSADEQLEIVKRVFRGEVVGG